MGGGIFLLAAVINPLLEHLVHTSGGKAGDSAAENDFRGDSGPVHPYCERNTQDSDHRRDKLIFCAGEVLNDVTNDQTDSNDDRNDIRTEHFHFISPLNYSLFELVDLFHNRIKKTVSIQLVVVHFVHPLQILILLNGYPSPLYVCFCQMLDSIIQYRSVRYDEGIHSAL